MAAEERMKTCEITVKVEVTKSARRTLRLTEEQFEQLCKAAQSANEMSDALEKAAGYDEMYAALEKAAGYDVIDDLYEAAKGSHNNVCYAFQIFDDEGRIIED